MNFLANERLEQMNWFSLSANPSAIHLLESNIEMVNWDRLSANPSAIHLLEANLDKVDWNQFVVQSKRHSFVERKPRQSILGILVGKSKGIQARLRRNESVA